MREQTGWATHIAMLRALLIVEGKLQMVMLDERSRKVKAIACRDFRLARARDAYRHCKERWLTLIGVKAD